MGALALALQEERSGEQSARSGCPQGKRHPIECPDDAFALPHFARMPYALAHCCALYVGVAVFRCSRLQSKSFCLV